MKKDAEIRSVMDSFRRIVRALRLSDRRTDRELGISVAQLFVLQQLSDGHPRSVAELGARKNSASLTVRGPFGPSTSAVASSAMSTGASVEGLTITHLWPCVKQAW